MNNSGSRPKFSVVLPCFNAHHYLDQAIASVRAQTVGDTEIIVVDDGSTDPETVACLAKLGEGVQVIRQENCGLPAARNTGFRAARGTYVVPLDCDDWLDPDFLERTSAVLESTPGISFVGSSFTLEGEASGVLVKHYNQFEQLFFNQLPYCLLIPRMFWGEVGGYDETMRRGYEDWEFNIRLGQRGHVGVILSEPLFHYRVQRTGMLKSISSNLHGQLWGEIQGRNTTAYRLPSLLKTWLHWRKKPFNYTPVLLFGWFFLYRVLPDGLFNRLFSSLRGLSHSSRVSRNLAAKNHEGAGG